MSEARENETALKQFGLGLELLQGRFIGGGKNLEKIPAQPIWILIIPQQERHPRMKRRDGFIGRGREHDVAWSAGFIPPQSSMPKLVMKFPIVDDQFKQPQMLSDERVGIPILHQSSKHLRKW